MKVICIVVRILKQPTVYFTEVATKYFDYESILARSLAYVYNIKVSH